MTFYRRAGKRLFDLALLILSAPVTVPFLLIVALLVRLFMGRGVLFRQERPGRGGLPFTLRKFRTMRELTGPTGAPSSDEERLTRFGRLLRSTSLDELPELLNVLAGDMSLVGPRPLLTRYLGRYTPEQARRHEILPGITGWALVNGRNALTWEEKFTLDVWYVEHLGFRLDCRILCLTIWHTLTRRGISRPGHATMPEFEGSHQEEHIVE